MYTDPGVVVDDELLARLPMPLAFLLVDAAHAKSPLERHQAAFYLWEATIKLIGAAAVVNYAERGESRAGDDELLQSLARPSLGHWWGYAKQLVERLAEHDAGYGRLCEVLLKKRHDNLPRLAGLDVALREALDQPGGPKNVVSLEELGDRLVTYRNREIGHGASGRRTGEFYERTGRALLAGAQELLRNIDPLAGRTMCYLGSIARHGSGEWTADCLQLSGETPRRRTQVAWSDIRLLDRILPERVYLELPSEPVERWACFHPLVAFDNDSRDVWLLNSRPKQRRSDYISYRTGCFHSCADLLGDQRTLLCQALKIEVTPSQVERWADAEPENPAPAAALEPGSGKFIGDFELLTRLGAGNMGVVYRARQAALGRQVALKCQLRVGDARSDERFRREIRALGRVTHANLVRVFTSGNDGDQWYYAMELVEGATLSTVGDRLSASTGEAGRVTTQAWHESLSVACDETRKSETVIAPAAAPAALPASATEPQPHVEPDGRDYVPWVVEMVQQAAAAAQALHQAGVVHRDIKPGNIMVSSDGRRACLMDLGLAQMLDEADKKLTRTRQFVGTLRYASPEQVLAAGALDGRSDVYSLGATLWELLTLRSLFDANDETPSPELMRRIQYEAPAGVRRYNPRVSRDLEAVVLKCLEKNPAKRYATAAELADDLGRVLAGQPTRARPSALRTAWQRSKRFQRVAMLCAAVALAVVGIFWRGGRIDPPENRDPRSPPGILVPAPGTTVAQQPTLPAKRFALLVGCTTYDNYPEATLAGPGNDVTLMRSTLVEACGFEPENIRALVDEVVSDGRPTRINILGGLRWLRDTVAAGDQVVILLAGHGSQQRAADPIRDPEPDGLDKTFLPCDVGFADVNTARVERAIVDDELGNWVNTIATRGAFVWLILDSSPAGAQLRADSPFKVRWIDPARMAAKPTQQPVPASSVIEPKPDLKNRGPDDTLATPAKHAPALVALYAGRSGEAEKEYLMPMDSKSQETHGLLTYSICQMLQTCSPPNYRELARRIVAQYRSWGLCEPTPIVEGAAVERAVMGQIGRKVQFELQGNRLDGWMIPAGQLHGITVGSVLAVSSSSKGPAADESVFGYVRVSAAGLARSSVEPCAFGGEPAAKDLPYRGICGLVNVDYASTKLRVAVDMYHRPDDEFLRGLKTRLKKLSDAEDAPCEFTDELALAHWAVQFRDGEYWLLPADQATMLGKLRPGVTPLAVPKTIDDAALRKLLDHLARVRNLLLLTQPLTGADNARQGGQNEFDVGLEMLKLADADDRTGVLIQSDQDTVLHNGDRIAWRIVNRGTAPADATLLYIDSHADISLLMPRASSFEGNRIVGGQSFLASSGTVTDRTIGREQVLAIFVKAEAGSEPVNFGFLAQDEPAVTSPAIQSASPLGKLLRSANYDIGDTHGLEISMTTEYSVQCVSWIVESRGDK